MSTQQANFSFDPVHPAVMEDPGPHYSELAQRCPFYHQRGESGEYWITSDQREIRQDVLAPNPDWSFKWGNAAKDTAHDTGIVTDPPFHNAFRNALLPGLSAKAIRHLQPEVEKLANSLIDTMLSRPGKQGCPHDLFAMPMPAQVMCRMLGAPLENHVRYKAWADEIIELMFHQPDTFLLDRPINEARKHIAFGSGIHFCIGAPVARMEAQVALRLLLERLPDLRLLGDGERISTWMYWGRKHLPVAWG